MKSEGECKIYNPGHPNSTRQHELCEIFSREKKRKIQYAL